MKNNNNYPFKRIFLIVLDSLGIGELPDANKYNDEGSHTIGNISKNYQLTIPNLLSLGYGNITPTANLEAVKKPKGYFTKMNEASVGKDTMTGHWELMGLNVSQPFKTFTDTGFPEELIKELEEKTGYQTIGNIAASGTEIIKDLGEEHLKTKKLIIYTSSDSVLQIAMHEGVIPIEEQYRISKIAREIVMRPEWKLGRVITRPFIGTNKDDFARTTNRKDYALKPFEKTTLNFLSDKGLDVIALGKINDIFDSYGINQYEKTISNDDGMDKVIEWIDKDFTGLCFLNLVDFDALYGHRRNVSGYGKAIDEFDVRLGELLDKLGDGDLLILTADHGNDPTHHGTDHTREYVPLIVYHNKIDEGRKLEVRETFADIGMSINDNFKTELPKHGKSFLKDVK